jgi:hypothetical protein
MTTKAWYWTGLGILAISFATSSSGRCLMNYATGLAQRAQTHVVPYVGMAEIALGRTDAGFAHVQSAAARIAAQQARMQAAQARMQAAQAELQAAAIQREIRIRQAANQYSSYVSAGPAVSVGPNGVIVRTPGVKVVCPRTHVDVPEISLPPAPVLQDPI